MIRARVGAARSLRTVVYERSGDEMSNEARRTEIGNSMFDDVVVGDGGKPVRLLAADGRCMFEVRPVGDDTIEVRGVQCYKVNGTILGTDISVEPRSANLVVIRSKPFDD